MKTANIRLPEAFGDRISFLRKLKGLTQAQLAEKLGISAQAVSKWESGLSCPDIMMLVPLADIFGVSTDMLLGGGQLAGGEMPSGGEPEAENSFRGQSVEEEKKSSGEEQNQIRLEWQAEMEWQIDQATGDTTEEEDAAQGQKRADRQASTGDDSTEQKRMSVEEQVNAGENDKERSQVKTEEQVKKKETAEAQSRVKTEHINEEGAGQPQSRSGQGSKTGASGTDGFGTQENVKPEADRTQDNGPQQDKADRRKWEEDWKNGTLEIRKVFRENNVMIHSLNIDIGMADAIIKEGDEFALDLSCYPNGDCREEVRDGVWKIKDRGYRDLFLLSNITNIFSERKIIIIIPRGYHFKDVKIKLGAGKLVGRGILADASTLDLGAGEIVLADYYSGAAKIKCGMGKIMLEGQMRGRCKLDCGMGEIAASLVAPSEYGYRVKVGMGDVRVGDNQFGGMGGTYKVNTGAENFFDINCGMGAVKVLFEE